MHLVNADYLIGAPPSLSVSIERRFDRNYVGLACLDAKVDEISEKYSKTVIAQT